MVKVILSGLVFTTAVMIMKYILKVDNILWYACVSYTIGFAMGLWSND